MTAVGLVLATLAALLHVYIFYLESLAWTTARAHKVFGTMPQEAEATRELAFNQGFYNLLLAIAVFLGLIVWAAGARPVGATLVFAGAGSMALAALVLFVSSPDKRSAALKQGLIPAVGVVTLAIGLAL